MKKTITHNFEVELPAVHNLELHNGPLGLITHSRKWYAEFNDKCPNCGVVPEFEPLLYEEVIEVRDEPVKKGRKKSVR